ncbi:MAG TPA: PAS domain-containing sensor histidine kinase [Kofleriaceae bacterium]|nr:PAS domain-containing sensor histidine kinase [Kofleriaceae bacterium]
MSERLPPLSALLDALARASIGVVTMVQHAGRFEKWYANEPAIRPLGYTVDEWHARPMFEVISPDKRDLALSLYERFATEAPLPSALELTFVHKEGREVRIEYAVGRGEVAEGHVLVLVMRGTLYAHAQLSLLEADRIALVGTLASGFAHETNNPLTSVLLNLRSLRKQIVQNVPADHQAVALRCLDDITTGAERIASNVRALQTLATRSSSQHIDLAAVVSAVLRLAAPTLEPRAHVIRQIFPVRPVTGEESRIGQAVLAMLLFSSSGFEAEHATAHNRIVVAVEQRADTVVVEVSDNGRELAPSEVEHAFDPFFRSPVRGAAVGVGLGVARSVAMTLGGEVALVPRPGGGAVITMSLPAVPDPA